MAAHENVELDTDEPDEAVSDDAIPEKVSPFAFSALPDSLVLHVMSYLSAPQDVCHLAQTSKKFKHLASLDYVWQPLYQSFFHSSDSSDSDDDSDSDSESNAYRANAFKSNFENYYSWKIRSEANANRQDPSDSPDDDNADEEDDEASTGNEEGAESEDEEADEEDAAESEDEEADEEDAEE
eukprot:CAMPEP_0174231914 /NCGR_PEP_ID=MMETSP0417-20130205/2302_1 /TAXON_ID=242541 /ORGANISM="Mayorella sp, Strain BSH-02190019" /LENGTH=181 /DNA_ID=CAMNT_0015309881 /DNA_START=50 /DNA_END=595 /DNA_ORIENTATION=-